MVKIEPAAVRSERDCQKSDVEPVVTAVHQFLGTFSDENGSPLASIHPSLASALACLSRLMDVFNRLDFKLVDGEDHKRLEGLAGHSIILFPVDCSWVPSRTPHEALDWMQRVFALCGGGHSEAVARRYEKLGGKMELKVAKGQGHNLWEGFFQCRELVDFVLARASPPK